MTTLKHALILLILLTSLAACGANSEAETGGVEVTYRLFGNVEKVGFNYIDEEGQDRSGIIEPSLEDSSARMLDDKPWELTFTAEPGQRVHISAGVWAKSAEDASVGCEILLDGEVWRSNLSANGLLSAATCDGIVGED